MKDTELFEHRQQIYRIGRITLKKRGSGGVVLCPVEVPSEGTWRLNGVIQLTLNYCGFRFFPRSGRARKRLVRAAVHRTNQVLSGVA